MHAGVPLGRTWLPSVQQTVLRYPSLRILAQIARLGRQVEAGLGPHSWAESSWSLRTTVDIGGALQLVASLPILLLTLCRAVARRLAPTTLLEPTPWRAASRARLWWIPHHFTQRPCVHPAARGGLAQAREPDESGGNPQTSPD